MKIIKSFNEIKENGLPKPPHKEVFGVFGETLFEATRSLLRNMDFKFDETKTPAERLPEKKPSFTYPTGTLYTLTFDESHVKVTARTAYDIDGDILLPYTLNNRTFGFTLADRPNTKTEGMPKFTAAMTNKKMKAWAEWLKS